MSLFKYRKTRDNIEFSKNRILSSVRKEERAITLIALVITIIVLIILAAVSIAMLTGENGILTQANKAKEQTKIAEEDEKNKLNNYEDIIDEYTNPEMKSMKIVVNSGSDKKIILPIGQHIENNYTIDFGDGTIAKTDFRNPISLGSIASVNPTKLASTIDATATHIYPETNKEYTITINGTLKILDTWKDFYNNESTYNKIIKIEQWGETELEKIRLRDCTNLVEIAKPIKNSFKNITDFSNAFTSTKITNIPKDLFANCPNATNFSSTFSNTLISSIPEDLFANCPNATDFSGAFAGTGITSIPESLFANCPNATDFSGAFAGTGITSIPESLFANCKNATNFNSTFYDTPISNIPENLFKNCSIANSFTKTFFNCSYLENYLPLWNQEYYNISNYNMSETTGGYKCYSYCDKLLSNAENISTIPEYWREDSPE